MFAWEKDNVNNVSFLRSTSFWIVGLFKLNQLSNSCFQECLMKGVPLAVAQNCILWTWCSQRNFWPSSFQEGRLFFRVALGRLSYARLATDVVSDHIIMCCRYHTRPSDPWDLRGRQSWGIYSVLDWTHCIYFVWWRLAFSRRYLPNHPISLNYACEWKTSLFAINKTRNAWGLDIE